ncbi:MAG: SpoIID/LytB domain-containing protein [Cyanobacteria bacterium SIG28]|nr:SpoIID/LytB domain-containing protein [Cyanobacteria bacterium SIG28]
MLLNFGYLLRIVFIVLAFLFVMPQPCYAIKIGLQTEVNKTYIGASTQAEIIDCNTNKLIYVMEKMQGYEFKPYKGVIAIKVDGQFMKINSDKIVIKPSDDGFISVKRKWYRGHFKLVNKGNMLTVINDLPLEEYIQGVVPAEMPSSWEHDAHKAQAIAARSYALANMGKRAKYGYDLYDTPEDQAYGGASAETPQTNDAVSETEGVVLIHDGKIIPAYYSASAGGQTLSAGQVWTKDLAYIKSVPSFDDGIKKKGHGVGMSQYGANNLAKKGYNAYQILRYFYANTKFAKINPEVYK